MNLRAKQEREVELAPPSLFTPFLSLPLIKELELEKLTKV